MPCLTKEEIKKRKGKTGERREGYVEVSLLKLTYIPHLNPRNTLTKHVIPFKQCIQPDEGDNEKEKERQKKEAKVM